MKIAFTNFITTLKRYKTASILNIAGLTLAFFAMYVIMTQVIFYVRYNQCIPDNERVFLLCEQRANEISTLMGRYLAEQAISQSPIVEAGGMVLCPMYDPANHSLWVHRSNGEMMKFRTSFIRQISLPMLDIIPIYEVAGNKRELARPNTVIVSQSEAKRLGVGLGDIIAMPNEYSEDSDDAPEREVEVVAIYKDLPLNNYFSEFFEVAMFENIGDKMLDERYWGYGAQSYFIKIKEGASPDDFLDVYNKIRYDFLCVEFEDEKLASEDIEASMMLPVTEMQWANLDPKVGNGRGVNLSNPKVMSVVLAIALLILVMAFINFVNFFFALVPVRLRAVNISKVFGASIATLRWSFVFEAIGLVVCALALMSYLSFALMDLPLDNYLACPIQVSQNPLALFVVVVIGIVMAVAAALYPAWYITSFNPSLAVKAGFAGSTYGKRLRVMLICVQFTISMILIITTLFVGLQYHHMVNFDLGFEQNNLLTFKTSNAMSQKSGVLRAELSSHPDVVDVASSENLFFKETALCMFYFTKPDTEAISVDQDDNLINVHSVSSNFFNVIGIKLMQGEWIDDSYAVDRMFSKPAVALMNISDAQKYNINLKDDLRRKSNLVIRHLNGYVRDVYTTSIDRRRYPSAYIITQNDHRNYYLRLQPTADIKEVKNHIRASIAKINPQEEMPEIYFFTQVVKSKYTDVRQSMFVIGWFALVAIVISLMGVFGIVWFETQHRRREIAIRKVFGSTTSELLWMLNSRYAKIVVACFIAATPVAWYVVDKWLQKYPERIDIYWWVFVVALLMIMGVTLALVTLRSWRAANENPADVVKGE
ncbi:MAG: FtsX-like permease family protein [Alistipes sp.]|nr:FtsX-like permease family protein [Alistipes sp.]